MRAHQVESSMTVTMNLTQSVENHWIINGIRVTQELQAKRSQMRTKLPTKE